MWEPGIRRTGDIHSGISTLSISPAWRTWIDSALSIRCDICVELWEDTTTWGRFDRHDRRPIPCPLSKTPEAQTLEAGTHSALRR